MDLGQFNCKSLTDQPFNLYWALKSNAFLSSFWWRFGKSYKQKNVEVHSRIELDKS